MKYQKTYFQCLKCGNIYKIKDGIVQITPGLSPDIKLSIQKWDEFYKKQLKNKGYLKYYQEYMDVYFDTIYKQIDAAKKIKDIVYLEIGCGPAYFLSEIAKKCKLVIGVDFCPSGLKIAKMMLDKKGVKNYLLIQANILSLPIKNNSINLIFGGGVIEHFQDTQTCVNELYRVTKKGGVSLNTVPHLNLGTLTYRQIWGNIPNVPILKQLAELIHIKILGGKHMIFGYEMSFLGSTLKKIHQKAGFIKVEINHYELPLSFDYLPRIIRRPFIWLAQNSPLFWPMIKVIAKKYDLKPQVA